ncbi:AGAP001532-PA-like protein [Anopheles sinensis]|uniref:AGAP001532-PA-like protein n=1 Tax=Anopheles sinensis TaxID=74873 RepID=A0A084W502_ANOSI|nr:AGAP001532-PA-like protein [Anopheles sinensis]
MYLAAGLLNIMDITLQHEYLQEYYQSAAGLANFSGTLPYGLGGLPPNGSGLQGAVDKNGSEVTIAAPGTVRVSSKAGVTSH